MHSPSSSASGVQGNDALVSIPVDLVTPVKSHTTTTPSNNNTVTMSNASIVSTPDLSGPPTDHGNITFGSRVQLLLGRARRFKDERLRGMRSWKVFFDKQRFSAPTKLEAINRANKNLKYYYSNYLIVVLIIGLYIMVTNMLFVLSMLFCVGLFGYYRAVTANGEAFLIQGNEITPGKAYTSLSVGTFVLFWLTGGSSTIFWLATLSGGIVVGHAATHEPLEDELTFP
eukprot:PhF_6_TR22360/c0_g1_i1/m.31691/K20359/RABAC1, PRAF1; PRA1 family protein 1